MAERHKNEPQELAAYLTPVDQCPGYAQHANVHPRMSREVPLPEHMGALEKDKRARRLARTKQPRGFGHCVVERGGPA
jgi:hypothetical protein